MDLAAIGGVLKEVLTWWRDRRYRAWVKRTVTELRAAHRRGQPSAIFVASIKRHSDEEAFAQRAVEEGLLEWHSTLSEGLGVRLPIRGA